MRCFQYDKEEDAIVTEMKLPWPLAPRFFMNIRYIWEYPEKEEYILIISDKGHERLLEEYKSTHDISRFIVGKAHV